MKPKELYNKFENIELISKINASFQDTISSIEIGEVNFGGKIYVFFIKFNSEERLKSEWREFNSFITAEFISTIEDDFSKWNTYVFYLSDTPISKSLKYEIENNKFSTRKIVIDNESSDFNDDLFEKIISDHIVNDIEIVAEPTNDLSFIKNKMIERALAGDDTDILKKLEIAIRNENKES